MTSKLVSITEDYLAFAARKVENLEKFFEPLIHAALRVGTSDLSSDALEVAAQVAADPALLTDDARRSAAVVALSTKLEAQGLQVAEGTLHAFVAAALAQTVVPPKVQVVESTAAQPPGQPLPGPEAVDVVH